MWQPFAKKVLPKLPQKSLNGKQLSKVGREFGKLIYGFFIKQCAEYTTKEQYDHSHEVLREFLLRDETIYQNRVEAAEAALKL